MSPHEDEEAAIRALLADARVTEPIPADVAARLEDTLEGLRAPEAPVVVPLRRRWAPRLLAAAAVVAVAGGAGVGLNQMLTESSGTLESADAGSPAAAEQETSRDDAGEAELVAPQSQPQSATGDQEVLGRYLAPPLEPATVQRDATRLLTDLRTRTSGALQPDAVQDLAMVVGATVVGESPLDAEVTKELTEAREEKGITRAHAATCPGPLLDDSLTLRVRFDGALAALVVRQPEDAVHPIDVWSCDGSKLLAHTTVPVRP